MKKIGIITCGQEPNYGACLQAFATQKVLQELGGNVELINYSFMNRKEYSPFAQKTLRSFISSLLFYKLRKGQHKAFAKFRKQHMSYTTNPLCTTDDFIKIVDEYSTFLVGSDQVWNPSLGINTDITLLRFYKNSLAAPCKAAYASSFGVSSIPDEMKEKYAIALKDFDFLSTREKDGAEIIESLTGKKVPVVLDPTMLLKSEDWRQYAEEYPIRDKYVLIYDMRHSSTVFHTAIRIAEEKQCAVYAISRIHISDRRIRTLYNVSPASFLALFEKAEFIVTDSFHGTVFSILNHKNFFTCISSEGAAIGGRIINLLTRLGLENHIISGTSKHIADIEIDYKNVDSIIENWRLDSKEYLRGIVENEKRVK